MAFAIAKAASQAAPEAEEQDTLAHVGTQSAAPVDTVEAELEALKAASTAESSEPHTLLQKIDLR
ncbi:hypothetical protein, partial [uncultured Vibrio sp.]|uniref:hypothetical protein n=1 Tax=uncultured Vibrio sp. TaxID=114054 RepID=UPI002629CEF3